MIVRPNYAQGACNFELHTHAPIKDLLYHLGPVAFVGDNRANLTINAHPKSCERGTQEIEDKDSGRRTGKGIMDAVAS